MSKKSCFIIMPFTQTTAKETTLTKRELDFIYTDVIKIAVSEYRENKKKIFSEIRRYDSSIGSIISGITRDLNSADLVIADLTGLNPNVMYELGVRHALKRGTIIITQDVTTLPSDLRDYTFIEYKYSNDSITQKENAIRFTEELHKAINEIFNTDKYDSPVLSYLKGKEKFWHEDELERLKDQLVIGSYIFQQGEEIRELLTQIKGMTNNEDIISSFGFLITFTNNICFAIADINVPLVSGEFYETLIAAKSQITELQRKLMYTDYLADYVKGITNELDFEKKKISFFQGQFIDYFELLLGNHKMITVSELFSEDGNFYITFLADFEEYMENRGRYLGLSKKQLKEITEELWK